MRGIRSASSCRARLPQRIGRAAEDLRAGRSFQGCRPAGMVAMGMGDENLAAPSRSPSAASKIPRCAATVGAGVDDRHLAFADDIGAGAGEGHWAGIVGDDPADLW